MNDSLRILRSEAFRRLDRKAQVFHSEFDPRYRTRLTHSLEVAAVARSLAARLGMRADVAEAIALAHDIGHPPFGHAGEEVLNRLMRGRGGFEHNRHGLRLLTVIEPLPLSKPVLDGLRWSPHHPEARLVDEVDSVVYLVHDIEDGLAAGLLSEFLDLQDVPLWRTAKGNTSRLLELLCDALHRAAAYGWRYGPLVARDKRRLHRILETKVYRSAHKREIIAIARAVLPVLFSEFLRCPWNMPSLYTRRSGSRHRRVTDYLASLSDRQAVSLYNSLCPANQIITL